MSNTLKDALSQATELIEAVNKMIPTSENLINKGIQEATKTLTGDDLKFAQKQLMEIQALTNDAKKGKDISARIKALNKQVEAQYKK